MELQFGKFKGRTLDDPEVTTKYLEWLLESSTATIEAIQAELARREQVEAANVTMAERMLVAGFRALSKEYKADPDAMRELTGARAALEEVLEHYFEEQTKAEETRRMNQIRDNKDARNKKTARQLLNDKNAEPEDIEWAQKILGIH